MKKRKKVADLSVPKRFPRLLSTGLLLALVLLAICIVVGISRQRSSAMGTHSGSMIVRPTNDTRVTSRRVEGAQQTGQIRPLTQEEAQKLAAALKELANQSTEGLQQVRHADGSVSMDLEGRFHNVALAKRNEDGTVSQTCVDNPAAGAAFFGIDPKLVGVKTNSVVGSASTSTTHK